MASACSGNPPQPGAGDAELGPGTREAIVRQFGDDLARLDLRVTRAGLVAAPGQREYTPAGRHLAVYVEPRGRADLETYVAGMEQVAKIFLPEVFDRLPRIESFDVCQEPPPGVDDSPEPRGLTQVTLSRQQARAVDWEEVDLAGMVASSLRQPSGMILAVAPEVAATRAWGRTLEKAGAGPSPRPPPPS